MSSFDDQLEKELEKLKKKKNEKKETVTPKRVKTNTFDDQLEAELESLKKKGRNTGKDTGKYDDFSVSTTDDIAPVRTHGGGGGKFGDSSTVKTRSIDNLFAVSGKEDFKQKSGYISTKSEGFWDKLSSKYGLGYNDLQYEYINNQNGIRDEISQRARSWGSDTGKTTSSYEEKSLDYMTADEVAVYNYYYQTGGKDKAQEFLDALAETLNARKAGKTFSNMEGKTAREILYGIPAGAEQFKQGVKSLGNMVVGKDDYIPQTATQILTGMVREDLADDGFNVLGNSAAQVAFDALNTGANMAPSLLVGAINPVAGAALMGGSASGNAYQQVLNEGHDKSKARLYATLIGTSEAALQSLLGGIGKLGGTSSTITRAVSGIENGLLRFSLEYGGKIGSEAVEEGLQEILDPIFKNAVLGTEENVDWENVAYSALLGGLMGAGFGASEVANSHLNKNESAVVKKEYNSRLEEAEAANSGKKLTNKQKNEIYEAVIQDMDRGIITTDTIEEVLGGENYTAYQDIVKQDNDALAELAELYQGDELKQRAEEFINNSKRSEMAKTLSDSVYDMVKDTRLGESYRDRARRGQKFEADVTQYDEKQRAIVQKAIDSGVLNNTNRTHDMVDFIARVSADTGVLFDFTNNEKLKDTIYAVNGKTVDGYITKDGITINVNSPRYINSVVGHEITHALEGTELYETLETALFEYAKEKGNYKDVLKDAYEMYRGEEGYQGYDGLKKIKKEAVANLVGDYLFTDKNFVNHLSAKHQNIFQKVWNEVKYMVKIARAGSNEAKKLLEVQKAFEEAYIAVNAQKTTTDEGGGVTYSYSKPDFTKDEWSMVNRRKHSEFDNPKFDLDNDTKWMYFNEKGSTVFAVYSKHDAEDPTVLYGSSGKRAEIDNAKVAAYVAGGRNAKRGRGTLDRLLASIQRNEGNRSKGVANSSGTHSTIGDVSIPLEESRSDRRGDYGDGSENLQESKLTEYNEEASAEEQDASFITFSNDYAAIRNYMKEGDVGEEADTAPVKYSLSKDSDGKQLTNEQIEYFKDSKVVDENGSLKVMYHGTSRGGHNVFDPWGKSNYGLFGTGSYFTDSKSIAESYTKKGKGTNPQIYETYLNITNPLDMDAPADPAKWANAFDEVDFPESGTNEDFYRAVEEYYADQYMPKWEVAEIIRESIEFGMGYDGITHIGGGRVNPDGERHRVYIAFNPEQVKNIDNVKPTDNPDIRFSLSKAVEETKDLVALHNLTEDKLMKSLELGGLPMPSLAITKADIPHSNFGEITLVFGRDTIDPKKNKKNKVYSADAWTPVFPQTEYEADSKVANRVSQKLRDLGGKIDDYFQRDLNRVNNGFESYLNSDGGEEGLIQRVMDNYGMKAAYLEEQGKHIAKVTKQEEAPKDYNPANADKYQKIMDILGVTTAEEMGKVNLKDAIENHGAELEAVYPGMTKTAMRLGRLFGVVKSYIENKDIGPVYNTVTDSHATQKAVDDALDAEGYEAWVRNLFSGIVKDSGIYNNKEIFTPSGNRRSFKQTHMPVTLENIVKAMATQNDGNAKNVSGFNGVKTLRAATAETFKSVEEMHQKKDRLQNLSQEQFEAITNDLQTRLYNVMEAIDNESGKRGDSNPFIRLDSIGETLTEIGESGKYGVADIQNVFKQYGKNVSDDTALEVKQLLYDVAQMPVNIFESKPQRVVNFDEAKVFVIPNNANTKLKQELLNRGFNIAEYDPNVEGDRQRVVNQFEEYKFSLSNDGVHPIKHGNWHISGKDVAYEEIAPVTVSKTESVAPEVAVSKKETTTEELFPDDLAPIQQELENLMVQQSDIRGALEATVSIGDTNSMSRLTQEYEDITARIRELEAQEAERFNSIDDANAPPEMDAPYFGESDPATVENPFDDRDWYKVGNQKVKAYMYENPEVKPFFQDEALALMTELRDTTKGEKFYSEEAFMVGGNEEAWTGVKRHTSKSIETLLDDWGMSYADIEKGLNAIIEDNGAENIAAAKKIEFMLNDRLLNGYTDFYSNSFVSPNQKYINLLEEMQINEYSEEAFARFMETADQYAPPADDIAPVAPAKTTKEEYLAVTPKRKKNPKMVRADAPFDQKTANILVEEPKVQKKKSGLWSMFKENVLDNGMVFEDLALKTKNRDLQAKWNFIRYSQSRAQKLIGDGADGVRSLNSIREEVEKSGKTQKFYEYLYHWLNVDRMTLENRFDDTPNKAVFGDSVTADMSRVAAVQLGKENPEFRSWARDVYRYNSHLRKLMVDKGIISQETADLWAEMYPHYVPIRRFDDAGLNIDVPLDTRKTGVNAPIKKATGGNSDILPLFDTMAQRTLQTYKAIAKNSFGVELKNTLGTTITKEKTDVDGVIDSIDNHEGLLQEGKNGKKPTFTVFENGEKVTFEITDEMYNAMKPASDLMSYTNKVTNTISNVHRGLLTEYNPVFMTTNAIKDTQDILINSQHPVKTYANLPRATWELAKNGKWFREYMENGGEDNSYFDSDTNSFDTEEKGVRKLLGIPPLSWISKANNFIERTPRLAEYITSREAGRSIEVSMLDAARVTTNFAAGGKLTKFANRNGATFLNASVQGAVQQARNIREAKANGLKGWLQLAGKFALAGLPAVLLNGLMWDDDDDYEELSDYVKQNYYIVGKYGDGKFVRIPKGRTLAVIQSAIEQVANAATGNGEVDLKSFLELAISNLAPNNPIENNILAPIIQVAKNETWYGEDLVPTRLQDLPAAEQFDESTDAISKWLGEKLNLSPYKINYLLDQYSGGIGDTVLPMLTPEAESGDNSLAGNMIAPLKSKFTTDSVMNNQNVSDFYDTKDELTTNAKASGSTDEDVLMNKYMNSINAELSDLYKRKREIQNSNYPASTKYSMVRAIQNQIVDLTKESLDTYKDVSINGEYATVGDLYFKKNKDGEWQKLSDEQKTKYLITSAAGDSIYATDGNLHYRRDEEGEWTKISDTQLARQNEVTKALGITPEEYWSKTKISFIPMSSGEYEYAYDSPENYAVAKAVGGYDSYKAYSSELSNIKADKDKNGKSISGSRKDKVIDYINNLDADYYTKIILFKNEYNADDTYNDEIVEYLNSRDDISYSEMVTILKKLGFTVSQNGTVTW